MNITLIGMPACGKSMVGVLLAKRLNMGFLDTDLLIQEQEGCLLKDIIARDGMKGFLDIEGKVNAGINPQNCVVAPGGSVIYSEEAMKHLKEISTVVYLHVSLGVWKHRIQDVTERGVAIAPGQTLDDLYRERTRLYEKYADVTIHEGRRKMGCVVDAVRAVFEEKQ